MPRKAPAPRTPDTRLADHEVRGVLAGAYRGSDDRSMLTHYAIPGTEDALCGRVKPGCLADYYSWDDADEDPNALPTCKSCLAKARKIQRG